MLLYIFSLEFHIILPVRRLRTENSVVGDKASVVVAIRH